MMEKNVPSPRAWKSRTAQYRQGKLPEHQRRRHSLPDGSRDGDSLLTQSISRNSVQEIPSENRPLCLKQIIGKLDLTSTRNFPLRTSPEKNPELSDCRSLPNISDLRLTEVALQNATAYRQNSQCLKQWSSFPSLERVLKENINYSRRKWRHYTELGKYNQMWRSLGRDVHDHNENRKGEKALCSGPTMHSSVHRKHEHAGTKLTDYSKENLSTQLSRQAKKSTKGARHWSRRHVLPRILLPD